MNKIKSCSDEFGCSFDEAARALAAPKIVQVSASISDGGGYGSESMTVICTDLAGDAIATISLELEADSKDLRRKLATTTDTPAPALQIVLPSGERLRDIESAKPLRELLIR